MRRKIFRPGFLIPLVGASVCLFLLPTLSCAQTATRQVENEKQILVGTDLVKGFDMGIDTGNKERNWLSKEPEYMKMSFPAHQEWAALFITVGKAVDKNRRSIDLSSYKTLLIDMRGAVGGEVVDIGLKTDTQPDTGTETKIPVRLTPEWVTYKFPLADFTGTDLRHLYVVTEFVYDGATAQTVHFRNIKFIK